MGAQDIAISPPSGRKRWLTALGLLAAGFLAVYGVRAHLLAPDRVLERISSACNRSTDWSVLYGDIDPDDLEKNDWSVETFGEFAASIFASVPTGTRFSFREVTSLETADSAAPPKEASGSAGAHLPWDRRNTRIYLVTAARPDGTKYSFNCELRRNFDGRWKFRTAEMLNGLNWTAYESDPVARAKALLSAMRTCGMKELWVVRPDLVLSAQRLQEFLAGGRVGGVGFMPISPTGRL